MDFRRILSLLRRPIVTPLWFGVVLALAGAGMLVAYTLLTNHISALNRSLTSLKDSERIRNEPAVGQVLPAIEAFDFAGNRIAVSYGTSAPRTLLFAFAAECGACTANWPRWTVIRQAAARAGLRTVFVDITGTAQADYLGRYQLRPDEVAKHLTSKTVHLYRLAVTPQLILLDSAGKVQHVWTGGMTANELEQLLAIVGSKSQDRSTAAE